MPIRMSRAAKSTLSASFGILLLLIGNYVFAESLYPESFQVHENVVTFNVRGSDAAEPFAFPEDRVGAALFVLLLACLVAFVLQFRNDLANRNRERISLRVWSESMTRKR
jgi:hypothetical protein